MVPACLSQGAENRNAPASPGNKSVPMRYNGTGCSKTMPVSQNLHATCLYGASTQHAPGVLTGAHRPEPGRLRALRPLLPLRKAPAWTGINRKKLRTACDSSGKSKISFRCKAKTGIFRFTADEFSGVNSSCRNGGDRLSRLIFPPDSPGNTRQLFSRTAAGPME